jgi:hypothetical protein
VCFSMTRSGIGAAFLFLVLIAAPNASAVTAEVARACDTAVAKAFPPRQVGNPAAGSVKGSAKDQREYFNKCIASGGKVDDELSKDNPAKDNRK